jgi:hypothetical protein
MSDPATILAVQQLSIDATNLFGTCIALKDDVALDIAAAVVDSENEALPVIYDLSTKQINTTTAVLQLINGT